MLTTNTTKSIYYIGFTYRALNVSANLLIRERRKYSSVTVLFSRVSCTTTSRLVWYRIQNFRIVRVLYNVLKARWHSTKHFKVSKLASTRLYIPVWSAMKSAQFWRSKDFWKNQRMYKLNSARNVSNIFYIFCSLDFQFIGHKRTHKPIKSKI